MPTAVEFIAAVAPAYNAAAEHVSAVSVILRFNLALSDGRAVPYEIEVKQVGDRKAMAKERQPINLPEFCPPAPYQFRWLLLSLLAGSVQLGHFG